MPINNAHLKQKAMAFVQTIQNRKPEQKRGPTHGSFAKDYNLLRQSMANLNPELEPILPPEASFFEAINGEQYAHQSYDDICTFCQQIVNLLP
jgi:hypothetical protein